MHSLCTVSRAVQFTSMEGKKTRRKHTEVFLTTLLSRGGRDIEQLTFSLWLDDVGG